jgi:hypothetical protein
MARSYIPFLFVPIAITGLAFGQAPSHSDVSFRYSDGKIVIQPQDSRLAIPQVFPESGFFQQVNSNPGFFSETDLGGGLGSGDIIVYNVLDDLIFWSDGEFTALDQQTQIRVVNNPSLTPNTVISGHSGQQRGQFSPLLNSIGQASPAGDFHSHVDFRLEPNDPDPELTPTFGAYGLKLSLSTNASSIEESDPFFVVFRFGIAEELFVQALDDFNSLLDVPELLGDFDADGALTAVDIDLLSAEVRGGGNLVSFDLNGDTFVDQLDRVVWVEDLAGSLFGDANLDSEVQFSDFVALADHFGQAGGWMAGDFDGDQTVQFADFVLLAENFGQTRVSAATVPEPTPIELAVVCTAFALLSVAFARREGWRSHPTPDATA